MSSLTEENPPDPDLVARILNRLAESMDVDGRVENRVRRSIAAAELPLESYRTTLRNQIAEIESEIPEVPEIAHPEPYESESEEEYERRLDRTRYWQMQERRREIKHAIENTLVEFGDSVFDFQVKESAIVAAHVMVAPIIEDLIDEYDFPNDPLRTEAIADAADCSYDYAKEYEPTRVDGHLIVLKKHYAKRQETENLEDYLRERVLGEYGGNCVRCSSGPPLHIHHINPIAQGGKSEQENLVPLCPNCHEKAHSGKGFSGGVVYESTDGFWEWAGEES